MSPAKHLRCVGKKIPTKIGQIARRSGCRFGSRYRGESSVQGNDSAPSVGMCDVVELRCLPCINIGSLIVPKYRCKISFRVGRLVQMQGETPPDWMRGSERFGRLGTLIKVLALVL